MHEQKLSRFCEHFNVDYDTAEEMFEWIRKNFVSHELWGEKAHNGDRAELISAFKQAMESED